MDFRSIATHKFVDVNVAFGPYRKIKSLNLCNKPNNFDLGNHHIKEYLTSQNVSTRLITLFCYLRWVNIVNKEQ